MKKEHKTKNIVIKRADVDKKIIPLIEWFNSFEGIDTLYCCEGSKQKYSSYVLFSSTENWSTMQILERACRFRFLWSVRIEVDFQPQYNYPIRYGLRFKNKKTMKKFIKFVENDKVPFPKGKR